MNIVISYHNFIRDYRGSLLLKYALERLGHSAWITPHWYDETYACRLHNADVVIACQISENSVASIADFAEQNGIHVVINSSEAFAAEGTEKLFVDYRGTGSNSEMISLQNIPCTRVWQYIHRNNTIFDSSKYFFESLCRFDISVRPELRNIETCQLKTNYKLHKNNFTAIYLSSFCYPETYADVPAVDINTFGYKTILDDSIRLSNYVLPILREVSQKIVSSGGVFLIKKHPWDLSSHIEDFLGAENVRILRSDEYIVPSLQLADIVLHSFSTAAIEAWLLGKSTCSIMPSDHGRAYLEPHLQFDSNATTFSEVLECIRKTKESPRIPDVHSFLNNKADGFSTVRFAMEISKLKPLRSSKLQIPKSRRKMLDRFLFEMGITTPLPPPCNPRLAIMANWEKRRNSIKRQYSKAMRRLVDKQVRELEALDKS
jgi:surface carbohydrate biosynthesis protein